MMSIFLFMAWGRGKKLRFTEEEREETECKKTEVTSEYKLHVQSSVTKKKWKTQPMAKGREKKLIAYEILGRWRIIQRQRNPPLLSEADK